MFLFFFKKNKKKKKRKVAINIYNINKIKE